MSVRSCARGGVPIAARAPLLDSAWQSNREPISPDREQAGVPIAALAPLLDSAWQSNREPISPDRDQAGVPIAALAPLLDSAWQSNREPISPDRDQAGVPIAAPALLLDPAWQSNREPSSSGLPDARKDPLPKFAIVAESAQVAVAPSVQGPLLRSIFDAETDAHPQATRTICTPRHRDRPADPLFVPPKVRSKRKPASKIGR